MLALESTVQNGGKPNQQARVLTAFDATCEGPGTCAGGGYAKG